MTKREKQACDQFLRNLAKHKSRRLVPATTFNKRANVGQHLVVLPLEIILKEWKKLCKKVK